MGTLEAIFARRCATACSPGDRGNGEKTCKRTPINQRTQSPRNPPRSNESGLSLRRYGRRFARSSSSCARRRDGSESCNVARYSAAAQVDGAAMCLQRACRRGRDPGEQPSERDANPRAVRSPKVPATPATPRRVTPVNPPRRGQVEREVERELGVQPEYDRRLRNLDDKLEELLKEIKKLKDERKPQESKNTSPRRARAANPGTPVAL